MKTRIQIILLVAAALYMGWGLTLLLAPVSAHALLSVGPFDHVTNAMFGAAMLGMMATFVIAAYDPEKEIVRAAATGMAFVGFTAAYLMFITKGMPLSVFTLTSLVVDLACCGFLFLSEARLDLKAKTGRRRARRPRSRRRR